MDKCVSSDIVVNLEKTTSQRLRNLRASVDSLPRCHQQRVGDDQLNDVEHTQTDGPMPPDKPQCFSTYRPCGCSDAYSDHCTNPACLDASAATSLRMRVCATGPQVSTFVCYEPMTLRKDLNFTCSCADPTGSCPAGGRVLFPAGDQSNPASFGRLRRGVSCWVCSSRRVGSQPDGAQCLGNREWACANLSRGIGR